MQLPEHGANSARLYESLQLNMPETVIDFSENCNPAGPPASVTAAWPDLLERITRYPDPDGEPFLSAAAQYHQLDRSMLLAGNGAAELLSLVARRYEGKRAIVIDPAFSEYRATLEANGAEVQSVQADEAEQFRLPIDRLLAALPGASAVYICTPNNPTGILPSQEELLTVIRVAAEQGTEVVLDEAFIDFADESRSFIGELEQYPHVIILRSMTKMYAIPGIRLGYAAAHPDIIREVQRTVPHWHVNGLAAEIGALCLKEEAYREEAIRHASEERARMTNFLRSHRCTVIDSAANYLSFAPEDARGLYRTLLEKGFVLRHSENFRGMDGRWLRIGMKSSAQMEQLRAAMEEWFTC